MDEFRISQDNAAEARELAAQAKAEHDLQSRNGAASPYRMVGRIACRCTVTDALPQSSTDCMSPAQRLI